MAIIVGYLCRGSVSVILITQRPLEYERVYQPLYKVADTPFHIQRDDLCSQLLEVKNVSHL